MERSITILVALAMIASLATFGTSSARAAEDPKIDIARSHNKLGNEYFKAGKYEQALTEYLEALEYIENAVLLMNVAMTELKLGKVPSAKARFLHLQAKYPAEAKEGKIAELGVAIDEALQKQFALYTLKGAPSGAVVAVDGATIWTSTGGVKAIWLTKGSHVLTVTHPEFKPFSLTLFSTPGGSWPITVSLVEKAQETGSLSITGTNAEKAVVAIDGKPVGMLPVAKLSMPVGQHQIEVTEGDAVLLKTTVVIKANDEAVFTVEGAATEPSGPTKAASVFSPYSWILLGGGLTMAATGGVVYLLALGDFEDHEDFAAEGKTDLSDAAYDDGVEKVTITYVLSGLGGALAVGGLVLVLLDASRDTPSGKPPVGVAPLPGGGMLTVELPF